MSQPSKSIKDALNAELTRSRRYSRPFSIVAVPIAGAETPLVLRTGRRWSQRRGRSDALTRSLRLAMRGPDAVWRVGDRVIFLLPETPGVGARDLIGRLIDAHSFELEQDRTTVAEFPGDATTIGGLLDALYRRPASNDETGWHPAEESAEVSDDDESEIVEESRNGGHELDEDAPPEDPPDDPDTSADDGPLPDDQSDPTELEGLRPPR